MARSLGRPLAAAEGFQHQALLYTGDAGFVDATLEFIRDGIAAGQPVLVAVAAAKIDLLRQRLADQAKLVYWTNMTGIGANPARIIPLWLQFVERHGGHSPLCGVGEPIWPGRTAAELIEAQHHEALLNLAFAAGANLTLLCPYDVAALHPAVIDEARRTHPVLVSGARRWPSADYRGLEAAAATATTPLAEPPLEASEIPLDDLAPFVLRSFVSGFESRIRLSGARMEDLLLAIVAVAQGLGSLRRSLKVWHVDNTLLCEVRSSKRIYDPLAGREWPPGRKESNRGLWVANQLCDLVQLRQGDSGTVVRLHMAA